MVKNFAVFPLVEHSFIVYYEERVSSMNVAVKTALEV